MKKILWLLLALAMTLAFVSCEEDGPSMNEDYAGVWYLDVEALGGDGVMKIDMTDTTFENSEKGTGESTYTNSEKGTVTKVSDGSGITTTTHEWITDSWDEVTEVEDAFTYELSTDGMTLSIVSTAQGAMTLTSVEP